MKKLILSTVLAFAVCASIHAASEERGFLGIKLAPELAPGMVIKAVRIKSIEPGSPALGKHIAVGDEIVEAEGRQVPGGKATELQPLMRKHVGETLHLKLKRANGETYSAALTAVKRPG
jgi:C-terminal processing protease CtpA/Prc